MEYSLKKKRCISKLSNLSLGFDSNNTRSKAVFFLHFFFFCAPFFPPPSSKSFFFFFVFCQDDGLTSDVNIWKKEGKKKREKTSLDKIHVINPTDETSSPVLRSAASFREEERTGERERETERERKRERRKEKARR